MGEVLAVTWRARGSRAMALLGLCLLLSACASRDSTREGDEGVVRIPPESKVCTALEDDDLIFSAAFAKAFGADDVTRRLTTELAQDFEHETEGRRLVVFIDGTWNKPETRTNVWRLYVLAAKAACSGEPIIPRYLAGVGTERGFELRGGPFGTGIDDLIRDGYLHFFRNYRRGDRLYIFGFSRGAYAARSLNGFVEFAGLIDREALESASASAEQSTGAREAVAEDGEEACAVRYAEAAARACDAPVGALYDLYSQRNRGWAGWEGDHRRFIARAAENAPCMIPVHDPAVTVEAIGVFDTVPALGIWRDSFPDNHRTGLYARRGYHALSIDEQRNDFTELRFLGRNHARAVCAASDETSCDLVDPMRGDRKSEHLLSEVWFPGGHGDVGGGEGGGLEYVPLRWMIEQFEEDGLFADPGDAFTCSGPEGESDCALARLTDRFLDDPDTWRRFGIHWRRPLPGDVLHGSVLCRMEAMALPDPHCTARGEEIPDDRLARQARNEAACVTGHERHGRYAPENLWQAVRDRYAVTPYDCSGGGGRTSSNTP